MTGLQSFGTRLMKKNLQHKIEELQLTTESIQTLNPLMKKCSHDNLYYQPYEPENNAPESLTCEDCGIDMNEPEPDWSV